MNDREQFDFPPRAPAPKAVVSLSEMTPDQKAQIVGISLKVLKSLKDSTNFTRTAERWIAVLENADHPRHNDLLAHIINAKKVVIRPETWRFMLNNLAPALGPTIRTILRENNRSEEEWHTIHLNQKGPTP